MNNVSRILDQWAIQFADNSRLKELLNMGAGFIIPITTSEREKSAIFDSKEQAIDFIEKKSPWLKGCTVVPF